MTTRVILSSSTVADYAFPVGIAALLWREVVGYEPFVILVGSPDEWHNGKGGVSSGFMLATDTHGWRIDALPGWPLHVTAQNCRYHASVFGNFKGDDWLMLSDADLFPLKRDFYHQHEESRGERFAFYYSNGTYYDNYPTCHIAARTQDWRDVMRIERGDLLEQMSANLEFWLRPRLLGLSKQYADHMTWMVDMRMFKDLISKKPWHPAECKMIERVGHPPKDRLDRSNWPAQYDVANYTDAHILKATHEPANWDRTRPILEKLIPQHMARIDRYVEDFRRA